MLRSVWTTGSLLLWLSGAAGVYGWSPRPTVTQGNGIAPPALLAAAVALIGVVGATVQLRNATFRYLELQPHRTVLGVRYIALGLAVAALWAASVQRTAFISHLTYPAAQYMLPFYFTSLPIALAVVLLAVAAGTVWNR